MPADASVYRDDDGQWRWRVKGDNGEIVAVGEAYTRRADAKRGLAEALAAFEQALQDPQAG